MKNLLRTLPALLLAFMLALAPNGAASETITVSAASSLIDAFQTIAREYEARHPGSTVQLNFAATGTLLQQIDHGAPADVLATADIQAMDMAEKKRLIIPESRRIFARNSLVLIQPLQAKTPISSLAALQEPDVHRIAIGNPASVPAGRYAFMALDAAGLRVPLQEKFIYTLNVRQALDYVARGEVDAGFVYGSDAAAMSRKIQIAMRVPMSSTIDYPIALVANRPVGVQAAAGKFLQFVLSPVGQHLLAQHGFEPVTP